MKHYTLFHVYLLEYKYHSKESRKDFLNGSVNEYHKEQMQECKKKMRKLLEKP